MEELGRDHHALMGIYFSCQHCQQKYVSAECVQEHSPNCHMQSSSVMIPKMTSYSSLNPQAIDLNLDTEGFPVCHEIIKKEPEDYVEDDNADWQGENEDSTLGSPAENPQAHDALNRRKLQPRLARQNAKISLDFYESEDSNSSQDVPNKQQAPRPFSKILRNSLRNPHSTSIKDRFMCRYCPRTFPYPSSVYQHEESHTREPKYSCPVCGERFRVPDSLTHHMKSHKPNPEFPCCYPGCLRTFNSKKGRWDHHKTHPSGRWSEKGRLLRTARKLQGFKTLWGTITPKSGNVLTGNESIRKPSMNDDKSPKNAWAARSKNRKMISHDPAIIVLCCYPDCSKTFNSKFNRWIHHKTHPKGNWNKSGRRPSWTVQQNQETSTMPPKLSPQTENFDDNESLETSSMPDLSIEGPMPHSETKFTNNTELDNVQESAVNDATIKQEPRDSSILPKTHRRNKNPLAGNEIEIMTAWGRKFKCDICHKMFATRDTATYHRLTHLDEPQIPCYIKGCSQMFFNRYQRVNHLKSVHHVQFRKGKPYIGSRRVGFKRTQLGKVAAKEIIPNVHAVQKPSQTPVKIHLNKSPKPDQNISRGSERGGLSPRETLQFTCGICGNRSENLDALKCHMLKTHAGPKESQAGELAGISTPVDNCFGSVQSTSKGVQIPAEVKRNEATSSVSENLNARTQQKGPNPRYPIVKVGDKKYLYCGFPGCDQVFNHRNTRYWQHTKFHNDAHRSLLTSLSHRQLSENKANESSSTQLKENCDEEQKKADMDSLPDFPFVQVNGKKYFWCDFPDCGVVVTNLEARRLHQNKHQMSSEQTAIAQNSGGPDPKNWKVPKKEPQQLEANRAKVAEGNEAEILGEALQPNQHTTPKFLMQKDAKISSQSSMQVQAVVRDEDIEADEQEEMSDLQNQSMDTLQFIDTDDDNPMEHMPLFSDNNFSTENIILADSGLGSELSTEGSSASNPALRNISNPISTETENVMQRPTILKKQKSRGRPHLYARIQIGTRKLFCCDFPGCWGVFNKHRSMYIHAKRHRMGKKVKSRLKLMENGMVLNSAEGSFLME